MVERTSNDSLNRIDAKFYWTEGGMKYVTSRKGPGWKNSSLSNAPTITDTSISFVDSGFIYVFDSTQAVVEVDFLVDCVDLGDTTRVQFRFDSTGAPNANRYFRGSTDYWPGFDDGDIVAGEPWPDMGPVGILCPGTHTVEIGDEFKVHALYNSSYSALGGVKTAWRWSSNLRFLGIDTVGTYLQGKDLTVTTFSNDSLYVHTSDSVAS
ncbi:MAG: hypothetical protein E4H44_06720 [Candidatus Aminicenantes bacterium]|nr:MAG: hypothetical protein E4H44_06720 [Candidatus Aminicenantes bacterium]